MSFNDPFAAAFDQARAAADAGEVPVGAALARDGVVIAAAGNRTLRDKDPTAHAEMLVIRARLRRASDRSGLSTAISM